MQMPKIPKPTRQRLMCAAVAAMCGSFQWVFPMYEISGGWENWKWFEVMNVALGAAMCGYLFAGWFGHHGRAGWGRAFSGALIVTILGALLTFIIVTVPNVDVEDMPEMMAVSILAPIFVFVAAIASKYGIAVWALSFGGLHWILKSKFLGQPG